MSRFVLGPAIETWTEPAITPTDPENPGLVGIEFGEVPIEPGGKVNLRFKSQFNTTDVYPISARAVYVPLSNLPPAEQQTPEWFNGSGYPSGSVATQTPDFSVSVSPAPEPAIAYKVQTVVEYPDAV